jgi:hypothetical protein
VHAAIQLVQGSHRHESAGRLQAVLNGASVTQLGPKHRNTGSSQRVLGVTERLGKSNGNLQKMTNRYL